jgi:hypothetical protein
VRGGDSGASATCRNGDSCEAQADVNTCCVRKTREGLTYVVPATERSKFLPNHLWLRILVRLQQETKYGEFTARKVIN